MNALITQPLAWLALLQRLPVLLQLLPTVAILLALLHVRHRTRYLARVPWGLPLLGCLSAYGLLLALLGQRWGLVLLEAQILSVWVLLRLVENRLLARWLSPQTLRLLVSRLIRPLFFVGVALVCLDALVSLQALAAQSVGVWFGSEIRLGRLSEVLLVLYLVAVGSSLPATALGWLAQRSLDLSQGGRRAFDLVLQYVIIGLALVWALQRLGINQTGVLAVAGGLSVGLGFGVKEVFSNFISGLWLLFEGSVRPGEVLMHEGEACEVRRLGLRAATLWRGSDNAELVVPNQTFFTKTTTTYTRSDRMRRCRFEIQAQPGWPPQEILALLETIAGDNPAVLKDPAPRARLIEFGSDTNRYGLSFSIADPLTAGKVTADVLLAVWHSFESRGILTQPTPTASEPQP
ncbi:MAG: mechanosensitive ion channel domain-containing protein [Synechococcaceae cyanobacterium]|nr:mechanosensitive ion channel domain-containing protein [Synechococcaceae cyanobacterium]